MAKPPAKKKPSSSRAKKGLPDGVSYTDDQEDDQETMMGLGQIGAGKTFTAASWSVCRKNPGGRESKMTELEDMYWGEADAKACAGFKHNNLKVRRFNFRKEMHRTGKSITYTIQKFLESVVEIWHPDLKVVIDTLSSLDMMMFRENFKKYRNHPNSYEVYKQNLGDHLMLTQDIKNTGAHLCFLSHGRWMKDVDEEKNIAVRISGGGQIVPDITGQAPKFYKWDNTLQWAVMAKKPPKAKATVRTLLFGAEANEENYEGKNRYEGLLPDTMSPPDLKKAMDMIRNGRK